MTQTIAYLEAVVGADITSFRKGMQEVRRSVLDVGGLAGSLQNVGKSMTLALTLPLVGLAAASIKASMDFEAAMRNVASISDDVAGNFQAASKEVLDFGSSIRSGPMAASEALYTVVSAGITNMADAMKLSQVAAMTAEAGLADLKTTTEALTGAMLAYNAPLSQAQHFSDVLTRTVQVGVGEMNNFATAFSNVTGTASLMGVSVDDVGAALAMLTQRGIKAASAGTFLNSMLTGLIKPNEELAGVFDQLGVATGSELIKKFGGLEGALRAVEGVTGDTETAIFALFSDLRARKAAAALLQDINVTSKAFEDFSKSVDGATNRAHVEQMKSFSAHLDMMTSAATGLGITIGDKLTPFLMPLVDALRGLFLAAKDIPAPIMAMGVAFGLAIAAMGPMIWILGTLLTPMGLLGAAAAVLGTAFATNFNGIRDDIANAVDSAIPSLKKLNEAVQDFFSIVLFPTSSGSHSPNQQAISDAMNPANQAYSDYMSAISPGGATMDMSKVAPKTSGPGSLSLGDKIKAALDVDGPKITAAFEAVKLEIQKWFTGTFLPSFDTWGSEIINRVALSFGQSKGDTPVYTALRGAMTGDVDKTISTTADAITGSLPKITNAFGNLFNSVANWLRTDGVNTLVTSAAYVVTTFALKFGELLGDVFSGGGSGSSGNGRIAAGGNWKNSVQQGIGQQIVNDVAKGITDAFADAGVKATPIQAVATFIGGLILVSITANLATTLVTQGIGSVLSTALSGAIIAAKGTIVFGEGVTGVLAGALSAGITAGQAIFGGVVTSIVAAIISGFETVQIAAMLGWDAVALAIGGAITKAVAASTTMFSGLNAAIGTALAATNIGTIAMGGIVIAIAVGAIAYIFDGNFRDSVNQFIQGAVDSINQQGGFDINLAPHSIQVSAGTSIYMDVTQFSLAVQKAILGAQANIGGKGSQTVQLPDGMIKLTLDQSTIDLLTANNIQFSATDPMAQAVGVPAGDAIGDAATTAFTDKMINLASAVTNNPDISPDQFAAFAATLTGPIVTAFDNAFGPSGTVRASFASFTVSVITNSMLAGVGLAALGTSVTLLLLTVNALKGGIIAAFQDIGSKANSAMQPLLATVETIRKDMEKIAKMSAAKSAGGGSGGGKLYASGGSMTEGGFVGDRGVEWMAPAQQGTILPTRMLRDALRQKSGPSGNNYYITAYGSSPRELADMVITAINDRTGGY